MQMSTDSEENVHDVNDQNKYFASKLRGRKCFRKSRLLRSHLHNRGREEPFCCDECKIGFIDPSLLTLLNEVHVRCPCEMCEKKCYWKSNFSRHRRVRSELRGLKFVQEDLLRCLLDNREREELYSCDACKIGFNDLSLLILHNEVHERCPCDMCEKKFNQESNLKMHRWLYVAGKQREGESPFACKICRRFFTNKINLIWHLNTNPFCSNMFVERFF